MVGVAAAGLLFVYLVLPGFVIGLMIASGILDPQPTDPKAKRTVEAVFCVPFFLGETVRPIGDFYEWQMYVASGHH